MAAWLTFVSALLFVVPIATATAAGRFGGDSDQSCVYTAFVRTGSIFKGGTDSNVAILLYDSHGDGLRIGNLVTWGGLMPGDWNYFERGNLDVFSGRGPCLSSVPCELVLISDGTGDHHGWYVNYVEITVTGPHLGCGQTLFTVEQWLASDRSPYSLNATVDNCRSSSRGRHGLLLQAPDRNHLAV